MAHAPDKKIKLRAAYIGGLPLEAAAEKTGVPLPTARNWFREARAAGDDWDAFQKASLVVAGGGVEQALGRIIAAGLLRCEALMAATADAGPVEAVRAMAVLGDTVSKLQAASRRLMPEAHAMGERLKRIEAEAKGLSAEEAIRRVREEIYGI
ncbi:MAG: DUF1804 family protein [Rhodocyclaceae bacterium]|nr:DUF1804 family protein [Rhodocyclaceae bacterium]